MLLLRSQQPTKGIMSNEITKSVGMSAVTERRGEQAITAMAAKSRAEVEARYVIALQRPRNLQASRINILEACRTPRFAEGAIYAKPVGGKAIEGLSIRFAEVALRAMGNICTECQIIWEDEEHRNIRISVTDLETNTTYCDDVTLGKTVERRQLKDGQTPISERLNSTGQKVFLVAATEDDMVVKVNAAKSKVIRNNGLRLIPHDILDEAESTIRETIRKGGSDPKAAVNKLADAFASVGVGPVDLAQFLGNTLEACSPAQLANLRKIYTSVRDGEANWADYLDTKAGKASGQAEEATPMLERKAPKKTAPVILEAKEVPPTTFVEPTTIHVPPPDPDNVPMNTIQQDLASFVVNAGHTFDQFRDWLKNGNHLDDPESVGSFDEIPGDICRRVFRAKAAILKDLARMNPKGEA